jgi:enoyl-CoA hydratase/carnithine racemase
MIIYIVGRGRTLRGMNTSAHVSVASGAGICEIRLNRPEKRNAITLAMYAAMTQALEDANSDDSVRVILMSGEGASFTAGNDLSDFVSGPPLGAGHPAARFIRTLPNVGKVLVAAVHGSTVGIGVTVLLHCDLVIAGSSARLSLPFVQLGLVPEAGSSLLLPRLIGYQRAAEMLLLGVPMDSARALETGLVTRVVPDSDLMDEARKVALTLAKQPPRALLATRALLRGESAAAAQRIEAELLAFEQHLAADEFRMAAQQFLDRKRGA